VLSAVLAGERISSDVAIVALNVLHEKSKADIAQLLGSQVSDKYFPTKRHGGAWPGGVPTGVVDHYTVSLNAQSPLLWFSNKPRADESYNSSAHYIVDRLGRIYSVVNAVNFQAFHCRGKNKTHIGIEHVNAGRLEKIDGKWKYSGTLTYPLERLEQREAVSVGDRYAWERYTPAQVTANILLKRLFACAFDIKKENCIDHQMADPLRKIDCGPLWPLQDINDLAYSWKPIDV